ncbi:MAG TPA: hypothetical protein EYP82_02460, partial [Hydrogenothermaceae bacterium]|nr:hypothetical protein [Hydrogenothermaceae bacterium]
METPSNNVDKVNENTLSRPNNNENTPTSQVNGQKGNNLTPEASQELSKINSKNDADVGRELFRGRAVQRQQQIREQLFEATQAGDEAKVQKLSEQDGALKKVITSIDSKQAVSAMDAKKAGIPTNHTSSPDGKPFNATVDLDSIGDTEKAVQSNRIMSDPKNHTAPEVSKASEKSAVASFMEAHSGPAPEVGDTQKAPDSTHASTDTGSSSAPKSKVGRIITWAATATGLGALFSSSADAATVKPIPSVDAPPSKELSEADQAGFAMQGAFNGLNAVQAGMEMKDGASTKVGDLAKGSSYVDGAKSVAKDTVDFSDFKNVGKNFADDGVVAGTKMAGKALGRSAMKKLPGVGVAAGAYFAAERAEAGDYIGAAMEFASGAVSLIPGMGTAASVAIDGALMKRDYDAATEGQTQEAALQTQDGQAQIEPISGSQSNNTADTSSAPKGSDVNVQGAGSTGSVQPTASVQKSQPAGETQTPTQASSSTEKV